MKLSIIIPSWKDPYLVNTIGSLLSTSRLGNQLEIIVVLDGYWPSFDLPENPRIRYIHLGKNRGMREAINAGVSISRGEFIMKVDEHCKFADGFDKAMTDACQKNWIMTPLRYALDVKKWENMEGDPIGYEQMVIVDDIRFAGVRWRRRDRKRKHLDIDENMAMQGSCWVMSREWWDKVIGKLDINGYGVFVQEVQEMLFKTWQAGGKLMLNKKTWYSHKHRSFKRTHGFGTKQALPGWTHSLNTWRDYFEKEIAPKWK